MTWLITGGAGFIGSHFVRDLITRFPEDRVAVVDCLTYAGHLSSLADLFGRPGFSFHHVNICDREKMETLFTALSPDTVVNFAAESHVDRSLTQDPAFLYTNVLGTGVLLDLCLSHGGIRFHQVSTDEVYGSAPLTGGAPAKEDAPLRPSSPYSATKAAADLLALSYHHTFGLPVTISRSSNNYGSHQTPEKFIPRLVCRALKDLSLPLYGSGMQMRDWLSVKDHCRAIHCILEKGSPGEVYNLSAHVEESNRTLAERICHLLGKPSSLIISVPDRPGHDLRYQIDDRKLRALGWAPEDDFEKAFPTTVEWYREHPAWWGPMEFLL